MQHDRDIDDRREEIEILGDVIKHLVQRNGRSGSFPKETLSQLGLFLRGDISLGRLTTLTGKKRHGVASMVTNLNQRILEQFGIRIVGETVYRLEKIDK